MSLSSHENMIHTLSYISKTFTLHNNKRFYSVILIGSSFGVVLTIVSYPRSDRPGKNDGNLAVSDVHGHVRVVARLAMVTVGVIKGTGTHVQQHMMNKTLVTRLNDGLHLWRRGEETAQSTYQISIVLS